jgi:hypothetical protein
MSKVTTTQIPPSTSRWLGAERVDAKLDSLALGATVQGLRETDLRRVLSQLTQQQQERARATRYRLHGQLAPLTQLGHGSAQWTDLLALTTQPATSAGYTADFFRDFSYELLVPVRAEALANLPFHYQLYYQRVTGLELDVLAGTLATDAWGGILFPFTATQPLQLAGRTISGLPVALPVTQVLVRLVGPSGQQRYHWPADWSESEHTPASGSQTGFIPASVAANQAAVMSSLLSVFKPASWGTLSDGAFSATLLGQLVPLWAAYDLAFTQANVERNVRFIAHHLGLAGRLDTLTTDTGTEVVGPRVRFDPTLDAELVYLSWPRYSVSKELLVPDTTYNRTYISLLGYVHYVRTGNKLGLPFRFSWGAFHALKLADFAADIQRVPRVLAQPVPSWAWLDTTTDEYVYRDLLPSGSLDGERGVDFPFLNNAHYVYERVAHYVGPDLTDFNAYRAFARVLPTAQLLATPVARN